MRVAERLISSIDRLDRSIGEIVKWLVVAMVLVEFANVVLRYVFAIGILAAQQSVVYMHALVFMLAAGYALMADAHVRIDILYREAPPRRRALVDLAGALLLLLPFCAAVFWLALPYVGHAWAALEGSTETGGLPFVYLLKSVILLFAILLALQGLALALRAGLALGTGAGRYDAAARG
ncbi:TRAP transporter small permease subunit [Propylenella binzhouense]|uniref:TRAP transporter small permease protein n=1 Tax=Propylenella binzhouense TaxID=2555902 RepID=A0A964WTQ5_9HYPH|nr:TRAP transporter small permease subunit [Propylenella binzhouense]MYZ48244.1 TRAP transporter small permease subunit [Propylenella binzhouense]